MVPMFIVRRTSMLQVEALDAQLCLLLVPALPYQQHIFFVDELLQQCILVNDLGFYFFDFFNKLHSSWDLVRFILPLVPRPITNTVEVHAITC